MKQYNYERLAKYYDLNALSMFSPYPKSNPVINSILKEHKVKTVLDLAAGTGVQAIYLSRHYDVVASDLSRRMLEIAKSKAKREHAKLRFEHGDMRNAKFGEFDAVITIYNAIGHLSEDGFDKTLKNIRTNLNDGGIYIFDILNADHLNSHRLVEYKFIDIATKVGDMRIVRFYRFGMDSKRDIFKIEEELWLQDRQKKPKVVKEKWDMKVYPLRKLKEMLKKNDFEVLDVYGGWGMKYSGAESESIVIVAQKR